MKATTKIKEFRSTHNLPFEIAPWYFDGFTRFRIGTCHGLWASRKLTYDILAVENYEPGNGHLQDVFDWFEMSCKRDKKNLRVFGSMEQKV